MTDATAASDAQASDAASDLPGAPDGFGRLWTPHRMVYIQGEGKPADSTSGSCPFCLAPGRSDEDGLIVARGESAFVVMNLFPYNGGHLLVCPYRHVADYTDLTPEEAMDVAALTQRAMTVVRRVSRPDGFNIGINQGAVAGAGIGMHLHQHIVPRWSGDMNFLPIVAQTRALPQLIGEARSLLAEAWRA